MEHLLFEQQGDLGILKINRPQALNALSSSLLSELSTFLNELSGIRVLIVTGQGDRAFIAGADIREMASMDTAAAQQFCALGQKVTQQLEQGPFISIAAVNGFALGGGLEIALACDFIYAGNTAKFGLPEVSLGLIPGFGGTQRLARAIGTRMAKELISTGQQLTADEALAIGLVNRICHDHCLVADARHTGETILKNSYPSVIAAKRAIDHGYHLPMSQALEEEQRAFVSCFACPDSHEGIQAFLEKRKPHFQGVPTC